MAGDGGGAVGQAIWEAGGGEDGLCCLPSVAFSLHACLCLSLSACYAERRSSLALPVQSVSLLKKGKEEDSVCCC